MKLIIRNFIINLVALFLSYPLLAMADNTTNKHAAEAAKHARAAESDGKSGKTKELLTHAEESLKHAKLAMGEFLKRANSSVTELADGNHRMHMTEAIRHLDQAIAQAKEDRVEDATKHVEEALANFMKAFDENVVAAIAHAKEAVKHGKAGHAKDIVTHAEESLKNANLAMPQLSDGTQRVPIWEAIRSLTQAIVLAKEDRAEDATKHVEEAITNLQASFN